MERDPSAARDVWRRLEAIHAVIYFAPEAIGAFSDVGYKGFWMGYFAGRAAPLGIVAPEVVTALFYNFAPTRVARALPDAWAIAGPDAALDARRAGANRALRRMVGSASEGPELAEAAGLAATAARSAPVDGRALFAANAALPWPAEPLDVLWHAATLLREHRGDGHVALLTGFGLSGRESNVFQAAAGNVPRSMIQRARDYDDDEWSFVVARLADRGLMTTGGALTAKGAALRAELESRTDAVALSAYDALGDADLDRLTTLLTPIARAVVAAGDLPAATPMGPTLEA
ncbi:MAG: hypothetical protein AB7Q42_17475 [Acidimicrobiia bacterium]